MDEVEKLAAAVADRPGWRMDEAIARYQPAGTTWDAAIAVVSTTGPRPLLITLRRDGRAIRTRQAHNPGEAIAIAEGFRPAS